MSDTVDLFLSQDQKYEVARAEISELRSELAEYARRLEAAKSDVVNLRNRLEEGVSKTAFKAWEAVGAVQTELARFAGHLDKLDIIVDTQGKAQARSDTFDARVIYAILISLFTSGVIAFIVFLWHFRS